MDDLWPPPPLLPRAACRSPGTDPLWFFPERGQATTEAVRICAACPEITPCREWSLAAPATLSGIFGGWSQQARKLERRRRRLLLMDAVSEVEASAMNGHNSLRVSNGAGVASGSSEEVSPEQLSKTVELCAVCSAPIPARRAQVGSRTCAQEECVTAYRKRRRAAYEASKRARDAEHHGARVNGAVEVRALANAPLSQPPGRDNLGPLFQSLAGSGALVRSIVLEVAGECWTVTRSTPNGGPP